MTIYETIRKLMSFKIENTDIAGAVYENSRNIVPGARSVNFYRVVCHASYEASSFVRTEVWLPENWNGCFLGIGNGGMAGTFQQQKLLTHVINGYATAQTDMGTFDGERRGINTPAVWKDFGWRAVHEMTSLAKALIAYHYGKSPDFSYFWGGSTGGQQALMLAQRFPRDYDGIIAGVPANNRVALHTYFLWNYVHLKKADGTNRFTPEEIENITHHAVSFFQQRNDGQPGDNFITYPWLDSDTVAVFLSYLKEKGYCDEQLRALEKIYQGPTDPRTGKQIYCGMPIGSEKFNGLSFYLSDKCPYTYPFTWVFGNHFDPFHFDFGKDFSYAHEMLDAALNANCADLSEFCNNGGKLLSFSGSADPVVPFPDAVRYYKQVLAHMGGYEKVSAFYKYFIFPGRNHGDQGDGANREWADEAGQVDLLSALRAWREKGQSPDCLYAARVENKKTIFSRQIYPYGSPQNPIKNIMKNCEIL